MDELDAVVLTAMLKAILEGQRGLREELGCLRASMGLSQAGIPMEGGSGRQSVDGAKFQAYSFSMV